MQIQMTTITPRLVALAVLLAAAPAALRAQATPPDPGASGPLYEELARQDSLLFDAAFVTCDAAKVNALMADDVEFYHDVTGMAQGPQVRAQFERLTGNCPQRMGVTRELVRESLRVYPMNDYGAVQTGTHRFVQRGGEPATTAMFVHLWRRVDGAWKVTRVISYDHRVDAAAGGASPD
jgi:ketosteroid isomerase-like protein